MQLFQCKKKSKRDLRKFAYYPSSVFDSDINPRGPLTPDEALLGTFEGVVLDARPIGGTEVIDEVISILREWLEGIEE